VTIEEDAVNQLLANSFPLLGMKPQESVPFWLVPPAGHEQMRSTRPIRMRQLSLRSALSGVFVVAVQIDDC
jgi:hypothetical protein